MSKKQLVVGSFLPALFETKDDMKRYFNEGYTPEIVKTFCPKALDIKREYHSLDEEERRWITKWVLNAQKGLIYAITGFVFLLDAIALICWWFKIGNFDRTVWMILFGSTAFVAIISFIVLPLRNKKILKRIDFDHVQECIIRDIIHSGAGRTRSRYYAILQWDEESKQFYEVLYMPDLPKCRSKDVVYHPYGMKFYIPQKK